MDQEKKEVSPADEVLKDLEKLWRDSLIEKGSHLSEMEQKKREVRPAKDVLEDLEKLWRDSHIGKDKHFSAAERKSHYHTVFGLPVILIDLLLGSAFFTALARAESFIAVIGPLLAFVAALFSAIQTFFNFHKATEGHRSVANRYLYISREGQALISGAKDEMVSRAQLWQRFNELLQEYHQANTDAEAFPTSANDFNKAKRKLEEEKSVAAWPMSPDR